MKRVTALAVVAVLLLSGCSGPSGGQTTTPAADGPLIETQQPADPSSQDGPTTAPSVPGIGADGVNETALLTAHARHLLERNHTFEVQQRIGDNRTRFIVARGARGVPTIVGFGGTESINYTSIFTGEDVLQRQVVDGEVNYRRPPADPDEPPSSRRFLAQVFGDVVLEYDGTIQRNGQRFHRLYAGPEDLTRNLSATVLDFGAEMLVTEDGVIRQATYNLTVAEDGRKQVLATEISVGQIGSTQTGVPRWYEEAAAELEDAPPPGTVSRTISNADLGASMTVVGTESAVATADLRDAPSRIADREAVQRARASPVVRATTSEPVENATITLQYDESAVPEGDERGLWVFVYNGTYDAFLQMETTVDPENDTVRATRIHPEVTVTVGGEQIEPELNGLPNDTAFVVMHARTYFSE